MAISSEKPERYSHFSLFPINALPRFGSHGNVEKLSQNFFIEKHLINPTAIYIHIPFCLTICPFCLLRKGAKQATVVPDAYIDALIDEMKIIACQYGVHEIEALYVGGGTPSVMDSKQISKLLNGFYSIFETTSWFEITFEGEAQTLKNVDTLMALADVGVKRISFGVQTFDENMRQLLGRTDTINDLASLRESLERFSFKDINIDLMYNLPGTTVLDVERDLNRVKEYAPTSVDCHPLKYISCSKSLLREMVNKNLTIPSSFERRRMFWTIRNWMLANGYKEQFVDQYSKIDESEYSLYLQHLYGLRGGEYIGLGAGARSHALDIGYTNTRDLQKYSILTLNKKQSIEKIVHAPLTDNYIACFPKRNDHLKISDVEASVYSDYYLKMLENLTHQGFLAFEDEGWRMSSKGLEWYQNLQEELLSPPQRENHRAAVLERSTNLVDIEGSLESIGTRL